MNREEKIKLQALIKKYNPILLHSMSIALSEDLINLIISNQDDSDFALREVISNKDEFKEFVVKEFFKQNSSIKDVIHELKSMEEVTLKTKDVKTKVEKTKITKYGK